MSRRWAPGITTAQRLTVTLEEREFVFDTDLNRFYVGDGSTVGGLRVANYAELTAADSAMDARVDALETLTDNLSAPISAAMAPVVQASTLVAMRAAAQVQRMHMADVREYGAVLDGVTDDSAAIAAALAASNTIYIPYDADGLAVSSTITLTAGKAVIGDPRKSRVNKLGSFDLFTVAGSNVSVENIEAYNTTNTNTGAFLHFDTSAGSYERVHVNNVRTHSFRDGFTDDASSGSIDEFYPCNVIFSEHRGRGVYLRDAIAFIFFEYVAVDYNGSSSTDFTGFEFVDGAGIYIYHCDVLGRASDLEAAVSNQKGFVYTSCTSVVVHRCDADVCGSDGFTFTTCGYVQLDAEASLCAGHGIVQDNTDICYGSVQVIGRSGQSYAPTGKHGVWVKTGCSTHQVHGICTSTTGDPVRVEGVVENIVYDINGGYRESASAPRGNLFHNAMFDNWDLGTSFTADGVGPNRWRWSEGGGTGTLSQQTFTLGDTFPQSGLNPDYFVQIADATTGATSPYFEQRIESVKTASDGGLLVTWFLRVTSGTLTVTPQILQNFGSGGSPSSTVTTSGDAITVTTTWQMFTRYFKVPSVSGKTLGSTANTHYLAGRLLLPSATAYTLQIACPAARLGASVQPIPLPDRALDRMNCRRWIQQPSFIISGDCTSGSTYYTELNFDPPLARAPTCTYTVNGNSGFPASVSTSAEDANHVRVQATCNSTGAGRYVFGTVTANVEL